MQLTKCVQALHAEYAELARAGRRSLSDDQARSLTYYRAELAYIADPRAFAGSTNKIVTWVRFVQDVERFAAANRRLPHQNNRLAREDIDPEEWKLCERLRYLQGRAVRNGRLCLYQRRRHACIPGFREHPRKADWDQRLEDYRIFIDVHRRAPRYRSVDGSEKSLAAWAATQRAANRAGMLAEHRIRGLNQLTIWAWGRRVQRKMST
jgi:hypothetical protein